MRFTLLLGLILLQGHCHPSRAFADPPPSPSVPAPERLAITGPATATPGSAFFLTVPAESDAAASDLAVRLTLTAPPGAAPPAILPAGENRQLYLFAPASPGLYRIAVTWQLSVDKAEGLDPHGIIEHTVTVGPEPEPTPEPGPQPDPTPDNPSPFPAAGLRVLILYETADAANLSAARQAILYGKAAREALEQHCVPGPDGKTREYRIWDDDIDVSAESELWQQAMRLPHDRLPWLFLGNGRTGHSGPLPDSVDEFLTLLKQHAQ